jgi:hypothetical protein
MITVTTDQNGTSTMNGSVLGNIQHEYWFGGKTYDDSIQVEIKNDGTKLSDLAITSEAKPKSCCVNGQWITTFV